VEGSIQAHASASEVRLRSIAFVRKLSRRAQFRCPRCDSQFDLGGKRNSWKIGVTFCANIRIPDVHFRIGIQFQIVLEADD